MSVSFLDTSDGLTLYTFFSSLLVISLISLMSGITSRFVIEVVLKAPGIPRTLTFMSSLNLLIFEFKPKSSSSPKEVLNNLKDYRVGKDCLYGS